jgi:hypothetical protein
MRKTLFAHLQFALLLDTLIVSMVGEFQAVTF